MDHEEAVRRFTHSPVAVLATSGLDRPHLVPVVFVVDGDVIYTAVDHKPKRTRNLQRLRNIERNPMVSLLADRYEEDWHRLWWVRADGEAAVVGVTEAGSAIELLQHKYPQYRDRPPDGPVIVVSVTRWTGWSAAG